MRAGWAVCQFANGSAGCACFNSGQVPCDATLLPVQAIIAAAKEQLAEVYVLRRKPQKPA